MSGNDEQEIERLREELKEIQERLNAISTKTSQPVETFDEKDEKEESETKHIQDEVEPPGSETNNDDASTNESNRWQYVPPYRRRFDFGDRLGEYITGFVDDVMEGVSVELERSLFREKPPRRRPKSRIDSEETAKVMASLGNEHRIRILNELSYGGLYASEFQETLKDISPSTLSSHLDVLEEAGLIYQERKRGRYLITIPGRLAIKMAYQINARIRPQNETD